MLLLTEKIKKNMEKQKTAVEWFLEQLSIDFFERPCCVKSETYEKALELERQQRESEFERGYLKCASDLNLIIQNGIKYNELANKIKSEFNADI